MGCDCRSRIEEKLLDRFKEKSPTAQNHELSLDGYCLGVIGNSLVSMPAMPVKMVADHPLKKGGFKKKTEMGNMIFSYCPFCGMKIERDGKS